MLAVTKHSPPAHTAPDPDRSAAQGDDAWTRAFFPPLTSDTKIAAAGRLVLAVERTLQLAQALAETDRRIDLGGLENWVGRLTAGLLDLEPIDGRRMRPALIGLLNGLDRLEHTVSSRAPPRRSG